MYNNFDFYRQGMEMHGPLVYGPLFLIMFVTFALTFTLTLALKGYSLWNASKRGEKIWFVALFLLNTFGILEIIYIVFVLKKFSSKTKAVEVNKEG